MPEDLTGFLEKVPETTIFTVGKTPITVASLALAVLVLVVTWLVIRMADRALARAPQLKILDGQHIGGIRRLTKYVLGLIGVAVALETLGVNLSTLFAAGAIFAVGLGFAMQNITQNFVSGLILIAERSVRQNDVIEVNGLVVRMMEMGLRSSLARTRDDEELIIPNSDLVQNTVKNYTLTDALYRLRARVGVSYSSNMKQVRSTLEAVGQALTFRSKRKDPRILLLGFGDSTVDWEVSVWISDPWDQPRALSRLNEAVWEGLQEAGITIAFPQLDLHLDAPAMRSLMGRQEGRQNGTPPPQEPPLEDSAA